MTFLIVATFKSHKNKSEVQAWVKDISSVSTNKTLEIGVAPSFPYLSLVSGKLSAVAQDVSPFPPGSYTGAVNAEQLHDLGVKYCLIGHSERRHYFHETPAEIANKATELLGVGITPILCLDEKDIFPQFAALDKTLVGQIIYCFEPSGNIGGSEAAGPADINRVLGLIRSSCADPVRVMYGGSVNESNLPSLLQSVKMDGVLVSSASLDPAQFRSVLTSTAGLL